MFVVPRNQSSHLYYMYMYASTVNRDQVVVVSFKYYKLQFCSIQSD